MIGLGIVTVSMKKLPIGEVVVATECLQVRMIALDQGSSLLEVESTPGTPALLSLQELGVAQRQ